MTDPLLCPFTLKNLSDVKEDDLAVIYETNPLLSSSSSSDGDGAVECGHKCTLTRLVSYLQESKACPVCQKANVSVVCDAQSSAQLLKQKESKDCEGRIISFRYGTTSYFLWVPSSPTVQASSYSSLFSKGEINALTRISSVFGVDVEKGLKVIHKGKVIYPGNEEKNESSGDISDQMLDISAADLIHRRKKPSLVVMGLSKQKQSKAVAKNNLSISTLVYSAVGMLTPTSIISLVRWGFQFTVSLVGGVCLFVRSLLYPPQPAQQ